MSPSRETPGRAVLQAAVVLVALAAAPGRLRAADPDEPRLNEHSWTVGNNLISTGLRYTDDGRVVTLGVRDRARSFDWASTNGGLGFRVVVRAPSPQAPAGTDPAAFDPVTLTEGSEWTLVRSATKTSTDATVRFELVLESGEPPV